MTSAARPKTYGRAQISMVDNEGREQSEPTEVTSLLGEGARQPSDESGDNDGTRDMRKPSWDDHGDFDNLPWWKTPTVRHSHAEFYCLEALF
jgi:hypothetical protein